MEQIKRFIYRYLYLIPCIQILLTFILCFIEVDTSIWVVLGNSVGYSILTSIVYLSEFILSRKKYCLFTKTSAAGVGFLSIFNFIGSFYSDYYLYEKDLTIFTFSIIVILTLFLYFQNEINTKPV